MTKTIAQLWNGNLQPIQYSGKNNSEIKKLEHLLNRHLDNIEKTLNEQSKEVFQKYSDCINEYLLVLCEQCFCDGFCIGTKITSEALNNAELLD